MHTLIDFRRPARNFSTVTSFQVSLIQALKASHWELGLGVDIKQSTMVHSLILFSLLMPPAAFEAKPISSLPLTFRNLIVLFTRRPMARWMAPSGGIRLLLWKETKQKKCWSVTGNNSKVLSHFLKNVLSIHVTQMSVNAEGKLWLHERQTKGFALVKENCV